jgi:hypothetical protein
LVLLRLLQYILKLLEDIVNGYCGMVIEITVFRGYGPLSHSLIKNIKKAANALREKGYIVSINEVTVPVIDLEEGFTPFVLVNGVEIPVPAVDVSEEILAEYLVGSNTFLESLIGLPSPPSIVCSSQ